MSLKTTPQGSPTTSTAPEANEIQNTPHDPNSTVNAQTNAKGPTRREAIREIANNCLTGITLASIPGFGLYMSKLIVDINHMEQTTKNIEAAFSKMKDIEKRYGVMVYSDAIMDGTLYVLEFKFEEMLEALERIERELAKFPPSLLQNSKLSSILLAADFKNHNAPQFKGGINLGPFIILNCNIPENYPITTEEAFQQLLFLQIASQAPNWSNIVEQFQRINGREYKHPPMPQNECTTGGVQREEFYDASLEGHTDSYGSTGPEEDMASIARKLICDPTGARQQARHDNIFREKAQIVRSILLEISDGKMNSKYWQHLEDGRVFGQYWDEFA